jgi:hypothetical protein
MLTWAVVFLINSSKLEGFVGGLLLISMIFDVIIIALVTSCWWGKYIK